ncbi:MAG: histidinol-phosphate transaminase [Clostridiales bacterium]|nr:histidinol-phosphate transaminase [Clostridiales bacterium]
MQKYVRRAVLDLKAYEVNEINCKIKLDANENVSREDGLNRYPDNLAKELITALSEKTGLRTSELIVGNGSSELIELVMKTFLEAGEYVVSLEPSFSMYRIFTTIYNGKYKGFQLKDNQYFDVDEFIEMINEMNVKLVILSNPNNPTATMISKEDIGKIVEKSDAIVVIDEAYIDFTSGSVIKWINKYKNLIVLRTFSKAFGLAGIRLGYLASDSNTLEFIKRVKSPYNVGTITQEIGLNALRDHHELEKNIEFIKSERTRVWKALDISGKEPIPSNANFILFKSKKGLYEFLINKDILVRKFEGNLENYLRVTIGTKEENDMFLSKIEEFEDEKN